ncbi:hypothetical protein EJB05_47278 [Eragrostis curvula]|uniref:Uncharacterized protein n=1 Tax=Eragrostis curvula TaxID=38414 RepID=A0A5J9T7B0_9POAL|nr:hypothetical protein EJB05_47278 [Eragrostis curvula]
MARSRVTVGRAQDDAAMRRHLVKKVLRLAEAPTCPEAERAYGTEITEFVSNYSEHPRSSGDFSNLGLTS